MSSDDVHITFLTKKAQKYVPPTTPHTHIATRTQNEALMRALCDENVISLILLLHIGTQKGFSKRSEISHSFALVVA